MGRISRWMPPSPDRTMRPLGFVTFVGGFFAVLYFLFGRSFAAASVFVGGIALVSLVLNARSARALRALAVDRAGEDIGTFARALDRRAPEFDPWVVRAVWDELQHCVRYDDRRLPLRPSDRLVADLRIDPDDLEDMAIDVARRVGREDSDWAANPMCGRVTTVAEFIQLVALQPRVNPRVVAL
jgi:hypothetical protein